MAKLIELDINNAVFKSLEQGIKKYRKELKKEFKKAITDTVLYIEAEAKKRCPVDTGRLRASITPEVKSAIEGQVGTNTEYALDVEYGTKPHKIRPIKAKILAWKDRQTGKYIYAKEINHPGTKAQPFLEPAYLEGKEKAEENFKNVFERLSQLLKRV